MAKLVVLILAGLGLSIAIAFGNYQLYYSLFFNKRIYSSITNKVWFRALIVPFIYVPGLSVIGLIILLYMRAIKSLNIN